MWNNVVHHHEAFMKEHGLSPCDVSDWDVLSAGYQSACNMNAAIECSLRALELFMEQNGMDHAEFWQARDRVIATINGVPRCGKLDVSEACPKALGEQCQHVIFRGKQICVECGELTLHYQGIESINEIEGLYTIEHLRALDLIGNYICTIEGLDNLVELRSLVLSGNPIERIEGLDHLGHLESLFLSNTGILRIENLDALHQLQYLDLDFTGISDTTGIEQLPSLRVLSIRGNNLQRIVGLHELSRLEEVRVDDDDLQGENVKAYGGISNGKLANICHAKSYCQLLDDCKQKAIDQTRSLFEVSNYFPMTLFMQALDISGRELNDRIIGWCKEFGFRIDGYLIDAINARVDAFLDWLQENYYSLDGSEYTIN
jgi:hypothetical protein